MRAFIASEFLQLYVSCFLFKLTKFISFLFSFWPQIDAQLGLSQGLVKSILRKRRLILNDKFRKLHSARSRSCAGNFLPLTNIYKKKRSF